uniref:Uncharacterized protein n=1 Tax=viral metagenome TaxID=1070528 RepID=A0A6M3IGH0_9ZZZZ
MVQKNIAHYLADLRLDLKDSGALWSDAELTRCVERAVGDYSRFSPRQLSKEVTIDYEVTGESFTTPAVSDVDYFVTAMDISASTSGTNCTIVTGHSRPDVPRPVLVTVTDANASITALVVIVKGYDTDNRYIEENFYLEGGLVQTGEQYFALVTAIEIDTIAGNGAADKLDVGTGSADGVYVQLAHKPVRLGTVTVTGKTLDTDYEMDYYNGQIAMKSGGAMVVSTAYAIAYTRSRIDIDLSTIIDDIIKVERIEYPAGEVPQRFDTPEVWGNILTVTGGIDSQHDMSDEEHLVIRYLAPHSAPSTQSSGSYPSHMDTVVELAASAYALFMKSLQYEHAAASSLTLLGTTLDYLGTAGASKTYIYKLIDDALAKVITYMETGATCAKSPLTIITTKIAVLRDAVETAVGAMETALGKVNTIDLDAATPDSATTVLKKYEDLINTVTNGADVGKLGAEYSRGWAEIAIARVQQSIAFGQEAASRLDDLRTYIEEAGGWTRIAETFIVEAQTHIAEANTIMAEATQHSNTAQANMLLADKFKEEANERRNEAWTIWQSPNQMSPNYTLGQRGQSA